MNEDLLERLRAEREALQAKLRENESDVRDLLGLVTAPVLDPVAVLRREVYTGPRFPTKIAPLDDLLGGGLAPGYSFVVSGEPFIGKTLLAAQLGAEMALQGAAVAILANDEDRVALAQRIGQYLGFPKDELSPLHPGTLEELAHRLESCGPIRLYPDSEQPVTVEDVARALAEMEGTFRVLVVDSVQTVRVAAHEDDEPETVSIRKTVEALKTVKKTGVLVLATSEANRGSYAARDPNARTRGIASGAGSRKIEFLFEIQATLTGDGMEDRARCEIGKNRLGHRKGTLGLHLDRDRARFLPVDLGEAERAREEAAEKATAERRNATRAKRREAIMEVILGAPKPEEGVSISALRERVGGKTSEVKPTLDAMAEEGLLEPVPGGSGPGGGRPSTRYRLKGAA